MSTKKGTFIFIAFTLGVTFALEALLRAIGLLTFRQPNLFQTLAAAALLFIPALGAIIARRAEDGPGETLPAVWPLPWGKALRVVLLVFVLFGVQNGIAAAFGWVDPQLGVATITSQIRQMFDTPPPEDVMALVPVLAYTVYIPITLIAGATLCAVLALCGEWGWRAYLLPRLEFLGRFRAYIASGLLWAVWLLPLLYCAHRDTLDTTPFVAKALLFTAMLLIAGAIAGEILRRTRHVGLAAVFVGSFAAQAYWGIWNYAFQLPKLPWAGAFGVVSVAVWLVIALAPGILIGQTESPEEAAAVTE